MSKWYTSVKCLGNRIYVRGHYDGVPFSDVTEFRPTLYLKSKEPTEYKNLNNEYLKPINPGTIRDTRKFLEQYKDVDGFQIYGNESSVYQYIAQEFPGKIEFDMNDIGIYYLDIETTSEFGGVDVEAAMEQILLITIMDYRTKKTVTFGSRQFSKNIENNTYVECEDEADLLKKFLAFWCNSYPEIVSGWNIETFDIPYIVKRIEKTLGEKYAKMLSPWKYIRQKEIIDKKTGKTAESFEIFGLNIIDYLPYFRKYAGIGVENSKLDTVAKEVLGETKLDHTEYDTFADFYTKDWPLFVEYNIVDTVLIDKLEKKLRLLQLAVTLAMDSKVNPEDTLSQGRMWDAIIYNHLLEKNIIIPTRTAPVGKDKKYKGAFVKPPQIGKFNWVASFDVSSLYPSLIRSFNISPETLVDETNNDVTIESLVDGSFKIEPRYSDYAICANGSMYRRDTQGFLPKIMEDMFNERSIYKKKMLEYQKLYELNPSPEIEEKVSTYRIFQESKKQCLNSAYGSLGNSFFRFYNIRNAEAITYMGQAVIKVVEKYLNAYLQKISGDKMDMVLAGDTDSIAGNCVIQVNGKEITISDFFEEVAENYLKRDDFNNNYVKKVDDCETLSVSKNGDLETKKIVYVMKHKVKKKLFEITANNNTVVVTEDHSIMVKSKRTKRIHKIKPSQLSAKKHYILYIIDPDTDSYAEDDGI